MRPREPPSSKQVANDPANHIRHASSPLSTSLAKQRTLDRHSNGPEDQLGLNHAKHSSCQEKPYDMKEDELKKIRVLLNGALVKTLKKLKNLKKSE